jgi:hypothetical protein
MATVERSQLKSTLRCRLFVLGTALTERCVVGGGDDEEPCVLELGEAGDELRLAVDHGRLRAPMRRADAKAVASSLFFVSGQPS